MEFRNFHHKLRIRVTPKANRLLPVVFQLTLRLCSTSQLHADCLKTVSVLKYKAMCQKRKTYVGKPRLGIAQSYSSVTGKQSVSGRLLILNLFKNPLKIQPKMVWFVLKPYTRPSLTEILIFSLY